MLVSFEMIHSNVLQKSQALRKKKNRETSIGFIYTSVILASLQKHDTIAMNF